MSIETWKAEFYPRPARAVPATEAAEHSLQKWRGYLPENMAKHGIDFPDLASADMPFASQHTCALCEHWFDGREYANDDPDNEGKVCPGCPLSETGNGCLIEGSVYLEADRDDPASIRRMVEALEQAVEWSKANVK